LVIKVAAATLFAAHAMDSSSASDPIAKAKAEQGLDLAYEISKILDTGLDKKTLEILIALCENGVNPEVRHGSRA
jgi:hypothetical protein